jgi:hypothetical protein
MKRIATAAAALGILASGNALAQTDYRVPWNGDFWGYFGASAGESKYHSDCQQGITQSFDCDSRDVGLKVFTGGKMNDLFGIEVGYTDFGKISASGGHTRAWAAPIVLTVGTPLGTRFGVLGKLGGAYSRTDINADPSQVANTGQKSGFGVTYGVAGTFAVSQSVQLRADWDRYRVDFASGRRDVDLLTAGLQVRF